MLYYFPDLKSLNKLIPFSVIYNEYIRCDAKGSEHMNDKDFYQAISTLNSNDLLILSYSLLYHYYVKIWYSNDYL